MLMSLVVVNLQNLSKGAFANHFQNLITISNVVMRDVNVRTLFVIIATVVGTPNDARSFLCIGTNEVNLRIVEDLMMFIRSQFVHVEFHHLLGRRHHCLWFEEGGCGAILLSTGVVLGTL